ncbi:hypothetical protein [Jannaschia ovalis]|uniref:Uncharacterized protein n=1 Tax=Jannaschia ovalis TaxID=3038773 RepID=A0ABY8L985_9RHOB|nr:hypothetical protein [Jannaschia sp. GRR-S6-38]WGH77917.1 hypothetical protein P8627_12860 [Jannaschia sp. GRR-S6-38]
MWKRLISLSLTFGLAAVAPPALAQAACGRHDTIAGKLTSIYAETVIGRGLQNETRLYEVWRSAESGSWTILMLRPDGTACVMASGTAWTDAEPETPAATPARADTAEYGAPPPHR